MKIYSFILVKYGSLHIFTYESVSGMRVLFILARYIIPLVDFSTLTAVDFSGQAEDLAHGIYDKDLITQAFFARKSYKGSFLSVRATESTRL